MATGGDLSVTIERVAEKRYAAMTGLSRAVATAVNSLWSRVDRNNIVPSWTSMLPSAMALLERGQLQAAQGADAYVDDILSEYGEDPGGVAKIRAQGFQGASDGRELRSLLYQPAINALTAIKAGDTTARAMATGLFTLDMITRTQVSDAGRVADGVALTTRPQLQGWVRMLSLPSCGRCALLAGKFYRWSQGFSRHPRCGCRHVPALEDTYSGSIETRPMKYFNSLSAAEQDRLFTKGTAQAIRDGADIYQAVNARQGMYVAGGKKFTRTNAGRRPRIMPEQIYAEAKGNREEAWRLLRLHGYIL